ncbi:MAG: hypothetical protein ACLSAF_05405 [Intestinimonas sp.]
MGAGDEGCQSAFALWMHGVDMSNVVVSPYDKDRTEPGATANVFIEVGIGPTSRLSDL